MDTAGEPLLAMEDEPSGFLVTLHQKPGNMLGASSMKLSPGSASVFSSLQQEAVLGVTNFV